MQVEVTIDLFPLLQNIGLLVERRAKELCPVDLGILRASIESQVVPKERAVYIGTNVDYAKYVEYGTARMIRAHGFHNVEWPVTDWEALRKRGGMNQTMPFLRTGMFQSKGTIGKEMKKFWKDANWR